MTRFPIPDNFVQSTSGLLLPEVAPPAPIVEKAEFKLKIVGFQPAEKK